MNRKQAKMLARMRATKEERRAWRLLPAKRKGQLRRDFNNCPWMMHPSFAQAMSRAWLLPEKDL